jgi:DNA polymerase epsilon subunit 1
MISDMVDVIGHNQIMQKVFALLLLELRKLRASIVFADFSRIIIATGKYNMAAAQGYCEYLLKTLKSRYYLLFITPNS